MAGKYTHFVAKITPDGGPNPAQELRNLIHQAETNSAGLAWFASPYSGSDFECSGNSICIIFHHPFKGKRVEAVIARIRDPRNYGIPERDSEVREFYSLWPQLNNWWPLSERDRKTGKPDIVLVEFDSLDEIPGQSWETEKRATETFSGNATFAGWDFGDGFNGLGWIRDNHD